MDGIYRSTDGGSTWEDYSIGLGNRCINIIFPVRENKIYLGTSDGFYKSSNKGRGCEKYVNGLIAFNCTSIDFNTVSDPPEISFGIAGAGIYRKNSGKTWYEIEIDRGFMEIDALTVAPSNSQIMYASYIGNTDFN